MIFSRSSEQVRKDLAILEATPSDTWVTARDISDTCGYSPKEVAWVLRILDQLVARKQVIKRRNYRYLYKKRAPKPAFYLSNNRERKVCSGFSGSCLDRDSCNGCDYSSRWGRVNG